MQRSTEVLNPAPDNHNPYQTKGDTFSCESLLRGSVRDGTVRGRAHSCRVSHLIKILIAFMFFMAVYRVNYTEINSLPPAVEGRASYLSLESNNYPDTNVPLHAQATAHSTAQPTTQPTAHPTAQPTTHPTAQPKLQPKVQPKAQPKAQLKPWESVPPTPIELFATSDKFIRQRHTCIKAVRDRQHKQFYEILDMDGIETPHPLLVDPAYHSNVGDSMLTRGEIQLLNKTLGVGEPRQCHYHQSKKKVPLCEDVLRGSSPSNRTNVALWQAGGNWGDLYRALHTVRIASMQTILENGYKLVGLPQSLYYSNATLKMNDAAEIKKCIALGLGLTNDEPESTSGQGLDEKASDQAPSKPGNASKLDTPEGLALAYSRVTFTWREKGSYEEAKRLYPFVRNVLVPDMAFQLGPYIPIRQDSEKQVDLLLFLRRDKESLAKTKRNDAAIRQMLPNADTTFRVVDWKDRLRIFGSKNIYFTDTAIRLASLGKVIVCDRLHAAVLAYLSGIPFVYTDQVSGKITNTLSVAFEGLEDCMDGDKAMWAREPSLQEAIQTASKMIDQHNLGHGEP